MRAKRRVTMFCFLHKWRISTALDTGKPLSPSTRHHLESCAQCRSFARLSGVLEKQLGQDGRELSNVLSGSGGEHFRNQRIIDALTVQNSPRPASRLRLPMRFRPVYAALLLAVIITATALFSPFSSTNTGQPDSSFFTAIGERLDFPEPPVHKLAAQVESPLNREMDSLKQAAQSTIEFLKSYLDTGI